MFLNAPKQLVTETKGSQTWMCHVPNRYGGSTYYCCVCNGRKLLLLAANFQTEIANLVEDIPTVTSKHTEYVEIHMGLVYNMFVFPRVSKIIFNWCNIYVGHLLSISGIPVSPWVMRIFHQTIYSPAITYPLLALAVNDKDLHLIRRFYQRCWTNGPHTMGGI